MLKSLKQIFATCATRRRAENERASIDAWALHFGREGAELWIQAMAARDAARLSNA